MLSKWYQQIAGDGSQTALVTVDELVYRLGYRNQQLENMVFGTCHNLVFALPEPQHIDFEVHFFINADGDLEGVHHRLHLAQERRRQHKASGRRRSASEASPPPLPP